MAPVQTGWVGGEVKAPEVAGNQVLLASGSADRMVISGRLKHKAQFYS